MTDSRCLILFARAPAQGAVKTRLTARLGETRTLALYRRMLQRQIALVNACRGVHGQLWAAGDTGHPDFGAFSGTVFPQQGADIGERMGHALHQALSKHTLALLIGCDSPGITVACLEQAFDALAAGCDAVLGPSTDGGYVLIGLRRWDEGLFRGVDWGTPRVLEQTRERLAAGNFTWEELAPLTDIDAPEDLDAQAALVAREYGVF